jgi:hypothetical protein
MCFGGPSIPAPQKPPPTATPSDPTVVAALDRERRRMAAMGGRQATILSSGMGVGAGSTTGSGPKTVLGA